MHALSTRICSLLLTVRIKLTANNGLALSRVQYRRLSIENVRPLKNSHAQLCTTKDKEEESGQKLANESYSYTHTFLSFMLSINLSYRVSHRSFLFLPLYI